MQSFIGENIILNIPQNKIKTLLSATFKRLKYLWIPLFFWQIGNVMGCFDGGEAMF